jgi:CHAT domain-containing protein
MERFYRHHLVEGWKPAAALRQAQLWLRNVTAGELAVRFELERHPPGGKRLMPYTQVSAVWRRFTRLPPNARPFVSPIYWAAFTVNGA